MSTGLRTTFWVHAIVAVVFGIGYLFAPAFVADLFEIDPFDPFVTHLYGAAVLGLGFSSILAALADRWEQVRIVTEMEVALTLFSVLVCLYALFFADASAMIWVAVGLFGVLFLLFGYFYLQERSAHAVTPGTPALR
jgi:hypothetical protein